MSESKGPAFRSLLGYHINSTSEVLRRSSALRFRREHAISLMEWRTLALIDYLQPVRLRDLSAYSGADKAQVSRIVSVLVGCGLVSRQSYSSDSRSALLELTPAGRAKAADVLRSSLDRDRALRDCLKPGEVEQLIAMLARIKAKAFELVDEEERLQAIRAP